MKRLYFASGRCTHLLRTSAAALCLLATLTARAGLHELVAHYPFDATNVFGDVVGTDVSPNNNHINSGSSWGTPMHQFSTDAAAGPGAVEFHGFSALAPPIDTLPALGGNVSISVWIRTTQVDGLNTDEGYDGAGIVWAYLGSGPDIIPLSLTGSKAAFYAGSTNGPGFTLHSAASINDGAYHHVVITRSVMDGAMKVYVDGALNATGTGSNQVLDAAQEVFQFTLGGAPGRSYDGLLDDVQIYAGVLDSNEVAFLYATPGSSVADSPAPTFEESLDSSGFTWTTGGSVDWATQTIITSDNVDAARSGTVQDSETSWIEATAPADGVLSFYWRVSSEQDYDYLTFYVNGVPQASISGAVPWTKLTNAVAAGDVLRWEYSKDSSFADGSDRGWLDQVGYVPTLAQSLDQTGLGWTTGGDLPWFPQTDVTHDSTDAAQSGAITDGQESWMETVIPYNGEISFYWKISSEPFFDVLSFSLNGVPVQEIFGEVDWTNTTYPVLAGDVLRWTYSKDTNCCADGMDAAWVDQVQYTPDPIELQMSFSIFREQSATLGDVYYAFPSLLSAPIPFTTNRLSSPAGVFTHENSTNGSIGGSYIVNSLAELIDEITNGTWTITLNAGDPAEKIFTFTGSVAGLTTNHIPQVFILSPTNGATGVATNASFYWTGPSGWHEVSLALNSGIDYAITNLPGTETSWISPLALNPGAGFFNVQYRTNDSSGLVTFSTPLDSASNPASNWVATVELIGSALSQFTVEGGAALPVELVGVNSPSPGTLEFSFMTQDGHNHIIEGRTNLTEGAWTPLTNFTGDGLLQSFVFSTTNPPVFFFRVVTE